MLGGLIALELVWAAGLFGLAVLAVTVAGLAHDAWPPASAVGWVVATLVGILTWLGGALAVAVLVPRPRPGRHALVSGTSALWLVGLVARRWLELPLVAFLWRQSTLLRLVVLGLQGARLHWSAQMSSDALVLDPGLFAAGRRSMLGSGAVVASHYFAGQVLVLARVELGDDVLVGLGARIGPGAVIGSGAQIQPGAQVGPHVQIGPGAVVGPGATVGAGARIGAGAEVQAMAWVPGGAVVPDGGRFPPAPVDASEGLV